MQITQQAVFGITLLALGAAPVADDVRLKALHRGRAGIYYRLSQKDAGTNLDNPVLDAVVIGIGWRQVEPRPGQFDWSSVREQVERWSKAGKGVVLNLTLYGQEVNDERTPPWLYDSGVTAIAFSGGGRAKGREIRIPKVWDDSFIQKRLEPLVAALAREFDGKSSVWYVMPGFGHIGNINAQPSKGGASALRAAGWTPEKWRQYCSEVVRVYQKHFEHTPLLAKAGIMLLRDRGAENYLADADRIVSDLGHAGVAVISLGLDADPARMRELHGRVAPLADLARRGATRLGFGDDWPLWVSASRRNQGPTAGHDDAKLKRILDLALAGAEGMPKSPVTILFCQEPEITASNPKAPGFVPAVALALKEARARLKETDAAVFGH